MTVVGLFPNLSNLMTPTPTHTQKIIMPKMLILCNLIKKFHAILLHKITFNAVYSNEEYLICLIFNLEQYLLCLFK